MQEVTIKLNEELKTINVSLVFASKNPQTNQTNVNLSYSEKDEQKWLQLFCVEEEIETLIPGIRERENNRFKPVCHTRSRLIPALLAISIRENAVLKRFLFCIQNV